MQPAGAQVLTSGLMGSKADDAARVTAISPDRKSWLLGGVGGKLALLDVIATEKSKAKHLTGHSEVILSAAFSPDGNTAATAGGGVMQLGKMQPGKDNAVRMWSMSGQTLEWTGEGHAASVVCLAFSSDGIYLASGASDGEIRVWRCIDGKNLATFPGHGGKILGLAFTADDKQLWSGSVDRTMRLWRLP
jgi:WD40 repeat protein